MASSLQDILAFTPLACAELNDESSPATTQRRSDQEDARRAAEASNISADPSSSLVAEPQALGAEAKAEETEVASCKVL